MGQGTWENPGFQLGLKYPQAENEAIKMLLLPRTGRVRGISCQPAPGFP